MNRIYMCIDLKSFYASVECRIRNLDPLNTDLVVADKSRTEKTICLAVSPSLKAYGISGRARLYEVVQKVKEINYRRKKDNRYKPFIGKSYYADELEEYTNLELDYIVAPPQMGLYIKYSADIYSVYLKFFSEKDIVVYSIDEVFIDITNYLNYYKLSPRELVTKVIQEVYNKTGITATAGIGTNLYLAKVAMDIVAKHAVPNSFGVRIAELDEMSYRKELWSNTPITDFWRVGKGTAERLKKNNIFTMGDIARCSINNEGLLYKLFGINAELLIDHAWGYEPCTIEAIKNHKPSTNSMSSGQVLHTPYDYEKTKIIVREMIDSLVLDIVEKNLVTNQVVLTIGYDTENLKNNFYDGEITKDYYGRLIPKHSHGTEHFNGYTSSSEEIEKATMLLFEKIYTPDLSVRRINVALCNLIEKNNVSNTQNVQLDIFSDYKIEKENKQAKELKALNENKLQKAIISLKNKYGKNAILKGNNLMDGSTAIERNQSIGGHHE